MKRLCLNQNNTKRGVASLYVVLFATILFGVVTLSFMRIILSDAGRSSDDDLSRSAYDSAMAGVEDAKTAINRYYDCISNNGSNCATKDYNNIFQDNCDDGIGIAKYLYSENYGSNDDNWEVKVQETKVGTSNADNNSDQAYTCVIVKDTVPDYRGTLTPDTRTKMIPLAVYDGQNNTNDEISSATKIEFQWHSLLNQGNDDQLKQSSDGKLGQKDDATVPATLSLTYIQVKTGKTGVTSENFNSANDSSNLFYDTIVLLPSSSSGASDNNEFSLAGRGNIDTANNPAEVQCSSSNSEFACSVYLDLPATLSSTDSVFLVVSLPYGDSTTDFSAALKDNSKNVIPLKGAQISVDSTGRTNQLVRRVETRLDPADLYFPYPQYELELTGNGDSNGLNKDFWITANCWKSNNGSVEKCANNQKISSN